MGKQKLNIEICRALAKNNGGKCISTEYVNVNHKLTWECKHKHYWSASLDSVKNHKSWCPECAKTLRAKNRKKRNPPKIDKDKVDNYHKVYYQANKKKILEQNKLYRKNNKEKVNKIKSEWKKTIKSWLQNTVRNH